MQQWTISGTGDSNQQWQLNSLGNGYYTITSRTSGLVLDLTGGGIGDSTAIQQWAYSPGDFNQEWQLVGVPAAGQPAAPATGQTYRIVSAVSGKPFGVAGASASDGAKITELADDDGLDQQWTLVSAGNGYDNLINVNSGKALDDTNGSTSNGTQMQQWMISGTGNSNQQWQITALGNGLYTITSKTSGDNLDLTNGSFGDGTPIQQWQPSSGDTNQEWEFIPVA